MYYLGVPEGRPGQLHLYCVSSAALAQGEAASPPRCLTCSPDTGRAEGSYYNQAATDNARSEDAHLDDWEDAEHSTEPPATTAMPTRKDKKPGASPGYTGDHLGPPGTTWDHLDGHNR